MNIIHEIPFAILACCVLHNLCLQGFDENERDVEEYIREGEENDMNVPCEEEQYLFGEYLREEFPNDNATPGQRKRNYLKDRLDANP